MDVLYRKSWSMRKLPFSERLKAGDTSSGVEEDGCRRDVVDRETTARPDVENWFGGMRRDDAGAEAEIHFRLHRKLNPVAEVLAAMTESCWVVGLWASTWNAGSA